VASFHIIPIGFFWQRSGGGEAYTAAGGRLNKVSRRPPE